MNNQLLGKVIFSNGLATKEQLHYYWGQITDTQDIGMVLRDAGIFGDDIYRQVVQFVSQMEWKAPGISSEPVSAPPPVSPTVAPIVATAAPSPPSPPPPPPPTLKVDNRSFGLAGAGTDRPSIRIPEPLTPAEPVIKERESTATEFSIEGNNPYGEGFGEEVSEEVKTLEGLQETRIVEFPASTPTSNVDGTTNSKLPVKDWICNPGLGAARTIATMVAGPQVRVEALLLLARKQRWSDVYITPGSPIWVFKDGELENQGGDAFGVSDVRRALNELMDFVPASLQLDRNQNLRVGFAIPGAGRFRLTLTWTSDGPSLAIHLVPLQLASWLELGIPDYCREWVEQRQGLILIGGTSGAGVTTTANRMAATSQQKSASLVEVVAEPLEQLWNLDSSSLFMEPGLHGLSMEQVLRDSLRRAPGVLVVENCNSPAERLTLLDAAESACLVIATLNALDSIDVLERFQSVFPESQKSQVRNLLSRSLRGVLWQGRQHAQVSFDGFTVNPTMAALVRKNELGQIRAQNHSRKGG